MKRRKQKETRKRVRSLWRKRNEKQKEEEKMIDENGRVETKEEGRMLGSYKEQKKQKKINKKIKRRKLEGGNKVKIREREEI